MAGLPGEADARLSITRVLADIDTLSVPLIFPRACT
jgi:hypothetical protein